MHTNSDNEVLLLIKGLFEEGACEKIGGTSASLPVGNRTDYIVFVRLKLHADSANSCREIFDLKSSYCSKMRALLA